MGGVESNAKERGRGAATEIDHFDFCTCIEHHKEKKKMEKRKALEYREKALSSENKFTPASKKNLQPHCQYI